MATNSITIKANNHRVHPVFPEKKEELLHLLLKQNATLKTLLCSIDKTLLPQDIEENQNLTLCDDSQLSSIADASYDLVLSYDIPTDTQVYLQRIAKTKQRALLLLSTQEQNKLYPLETLLGRTIKQDVIEGFALEIQATPKKEYVHKEDTQAKPSKYSSGKKPNKYLGKDENGKAIFSGKSGERNHRYDGTPKDTTTKLTGKKINVKAKKKD